MIPSAFSFLPLLLSLHPLQQSKTVQQARRIPEMSRIGYDHSILFVRFSRVRNEFDKIPFLYTAWHLQALLSHVVDDVLDDL